MRPDEFDKLVEWAYGRIPLRFRRRLKNVAFLVEAEPSPTQLAGAGTGPGSTLLGLYQGMAKPSKTLRSVSGLP